MSDERGGEKGNNPVSPPQRRGDDILIRGNNPIAPRLSGDDGERGNNPLPPPPAVPPDPEPSTGNNPLPPPPVQPPPVEQ
jgi:hypothetical protein